MSNIQKEIQDAELLAKKELDIEVKVLSEKMSQARKQATDILSSSQKDSDSSFFAKKEILEEKLAKSEEKAFSDLVSKFKKIDSEKTALIKKGVLFLMSRLSK